MLLFGVLVANDVMVLAQGASSWYRIVESYIGPGSTLESGSGNYTIEAGQQSVSNTGVTAGSSNS